ncbi:Fic family protein [Persephonella hydrogeniphila]|uniref:Fic family protein n=1 Tax=Persephonella hydrogeniphila TaxID=198703 RepID=A0A285NGZ3_9AQUI|nr:Fic family protein [Persephonella hydrogeniphila]SNZ06921.1 Fic family protein [Persephonella hydrogeniphila]
MNEKLILKRKKILESLGGIPEPVIENKEWLYLLEEETRNSILIEGYFLDEEELEQVLAGNKPLSKSQEEAIKYFKTAKFIYGLAYENYKSKEFLFGIPLIRQINKELGFNGKFRKGKIKIAGAKFEPPENYIEDWLKIFIDYVYSINENFFNNLSISHAFFEEIHPFIDGNGRTGRIILNYILISNGYPLVIIKGADRNKQIYYKGLEEIDLQLSKLFTKYKNTLPDKEEVLAKLKEAKSKILKNLILEGLRESLDRLIISKHEEKGEELKPVSKLLQNLGYSPESTRQLIKRGKIIAVKIKNTWYSTENLVRMLLKGRSI